MSIPSIPLFISVRGKLNIEFPLPSFFVQQNNRMYVKRAAHVPKIYCVMQFQDPAPKWHECRSQLRTSRGCLCAADGTKLNSTTVGITWNSEEFSCISGMSSKSYLTAWLTNIRSDTTEQVVSYCISFKDLYVTLSST
jgi:hypothetical protein